MSFTSKVAFLAEKVSDKIQSDALENPDKVYFPNFGSDDNILKSGFSINRVFANIGGFEIYWYGVIITFGLLLALIYGFKKSKQVGCDPDRVTDAVVLGIIGAVIGLRAYYVIFSWDNYVDETGRVMWAEIFNIRDGGLAFYGGLIGAILVGGIVAKLRKLRLTALLDVVGPCFLIGSCIGRWGNFANQEAFGSNTNMPWGMFSYSTYKYLSNHSSQLLEKGVEVEPFAPVHPCFLYESLWCLVGFILLHLYFKHRKFDGEVFLMYIGWYGLGRAIIEGFRTDSLYIMNIRVSQLVAGSLFVISVVLIIVFRSIVKRNDQYQFFYQTDISKAQLEQSNKYDEFMKEKKELKKKISQAKQNGESFAEFKQELDTKYSSKALKEYLGK